MSEKPMDQFLFEYGDRPALDNRSYDEMGDEPAAQDSFTSIKDDLGSRSRMMAILAGQQQFEYSLLDNPKMVRALVDQVSVMIKNKERITLENSSVSKRIKELEKVEYKTPAERDELTNLQNKNKAYQLQKTLMLFGPKLKEIDDILVRIENRVDVTDKTLKKYESLVSEIEDAIFSETYVRKNLSYDRGEASAIMKKPTATDNFPIKFTANDGATYYGIVRPPSGMITWEGKLAREAWLTDSGIRGLVLGLTSSKKYTQDEILKIRISKDDFKVLSKEKLNDEMFALKLTNGKKKIEFDDSDKVKEAIRNYIFNSDNGGAKKNVTDYSTMNQSSIDDVISGAKTKDVSASLDNQGRPRDLTSAIDSIEFWRFIRGLL